MTSTVKPPSSNTGATITATPPQTVDVPEKNRVLIDWLAFTIPTNDPIDVIQMMHLDPTSFTKLGGGMGYRCSLRLGQISVFHDGAENQGCHVVMSGQGCREYESFSTHKTWRDLFALIHIKKGHLTRLDVAFDTVDGSLSMSKIWRCIKTGHIKATTSVGRRVESFELTQNGTIPTGETIYFGSPISAVQYRIYDKAAQLKANSPWIRLEIQLRKDRAQNFSEEVVKKTSSIAELATGVINSHFAFINLDDSNKTRCTLKSWWSAWLLHNSKLSLVKAKAQKILLDIMAHLENQYAPSFALLAQGLNSKVFGAFFSGMVKLGKERFTSRHHKILETTRLSKQSFGLRSLAYDLPF